MGNGRGYGDVRPLSTHASLEPLSIGRGDASANSGDGRLKASVKAQSGLGFCTATRIPVKLSLWGFG